jgi:hypothetical protein
MVVMMGVVVLMMADSHHARGGWHIDGTFSYH